MGGVAIPTEPAGATTEDDEFDAFVGEVECGLRRALVASFGTEVGRDAAADALVWAWEHWPRPRDMDNPGGYLYRVGQSAARRRLRRERRAVVVVLPPVAVDDVVVEPALDQALVALSPRQRAAVLLVHGYGYSLDESARLMACSVSTVRNHVARALTHLRAALGGDHES